MSEFLRSYFDSSQIVKKVTVKDVKTGKSYTETYDKVVISTGSQPIKPPIPGIFEATNLFTLRNIP